MTSLTEQLECTRFHDASLEECALEGDSLRLEFQDISLEWGKEEYYSAIVILSGVRAIRRFDVPVAQLTMEGEGEVLQFRRGEGRALLLVEWHTYQPTTRTFVQYEIDYATASVAVAVAVAVAVEKQHGLSI